MTIAAETIVDRDIGIGGTDDSQLFFFFSLQLKMIMCRCDSVMHSTTKCPVSESEIRTKPKEMCKTKTNP